MKVAMESLRNSLEREENCISDNLKKHPVLAQILGFL